MQHKELSVLLFAVGLASCASTSQNSVGDVETRRFRVENRFEVTVPEDAETIQAWFALPDEDDDLQTVSDLEISLGDAHPSGLEMEQVRDERGNRFLHLSGPVRGGESFEVGTSFDLARREDRHELDPADTRPLTDGERAELAAYLAPSTHIVIDDDVRRIAAEVVGAERNPVRQARLVYDHILDRVTYWVKDPSTMKSSGVGSSTYCIEAGCGNCTDFHSGYAAIARAAGLPVRMVYGSFFKSPLDGVDQDQSYHCWIEFWAPELGWLPIDVAVADIFVDDFELTEANRTPVSLTVAAGYQGPDPALVEYYFGNIEARRVTWNRGRDLALPGATAATVNALPKAHVEVDGRPLAEKAGWTRKLTFTEVK